MEKFELNITDLSEEEIPWVSSFLKCEEELESYDIQEKKHDSNYSMVNNYYKMLYMVLKYHNLRSDEIILNTPLKRMIKINRIVSSKEFTPMKVDFAAFNGICFPADRQKETVQVPRRRDLILCPALCLRQARHRGFPHGFPVRSFICPCQPASERSYLYSDPDPIYPSFPQDSFFPACSHTHFPLYFFPC